MTPADLETVFEELALAIDATAEPKRELFLAKLALLLAHDLNDPARLRSHLAAAAAKLDA